MEFKEIEPKNQAEAETDAYIEPKYNYTPETEVGMNKSVVPIPEAETELLLEPESINRQSGNKKWSLSSLIIGVLVGIAIGGTVTGLLMHFTNGELNSQFCIEYSFFVSHSL